MSRKSVGSSIGILVPIMTLGLLTTGLARAQENQPATPSAASQNAQAKPAEQDEGASGTEALQKATQNPVASLISVPLQNNTNFDIGPLDRTQNVLNIQPVIPVRISEKWNLITRVIVPLVYQPDVT